MSVLGRTSKDINIVQETGDSETDIMSQKAVTDLVKQAILESWAGEY